MGFEDEIFGRYSRLYDNRREVEFSLNEYLGKCADDPSYYAGAAGAPAESDRRAGHDRHQPGRASRAHLHEPHDQGLSRSSRISSGWRRRSSASSGSSGMPHKASRSESKSFISWVRSAAANPRSPSA